MPEASKPVNVEALKKLVRTVPDFPKPGICFTTSPRCSRTRPALRN